jgi:MSHA biogenesis protein MshL
MRKQEKRIKVRILTTMRFLVVTFLLGNGGCSSSPASRTTSEKMAAVIEKATDENHAIERQAFPNMASSVKNALMPNMLATQERRHLPKVEKRFDVFAEEVPAKTFFLSLAQDTPYNIAVHPDVSGKISLQLKKVTLFEVLETLRTMYGYDFKQMRQRIEISPAVLQTRAFQINYLDLQRGGKSQIRVAAGGLNSNNQSNGGTGSTNPQNNNSTPILNSSIETNTNSDFWGELKNSLETIIGGGAGRKVAISPHSSLVVVQAMPDELRKVEEFLAKAELSLNRQVILDAKILEVQLHDGFQAGINWASIGRRFRMAQFNGTSINTAIGMDESLPLDSTNLLNNTRNFTGPDGLDTELNPGSFGGVFALALNYKDLSAFVELLSSQGKVQVLSSPRVSTMNNQKALIKVGTDKFFITNVTTNTTTAANGSTSNFPTVTFDSFFSGIALDVTPQISSLDEVTLHIHPTISDVVDDTKSFTLNGTSQSVPLAASHVRESDSVIRAKNGQMVIIGGLMQDKVTDLKQGVPVLKDLPLLGNIFRHRVKTNAKSELVILLRPTVVANKTWGDTMDEERERIHKLNQEVMNEENKYHCKGNGCVK